MKDDIIHQSELSLTNQRIRQKKTFEGVLPYENRFNNQKAGNIIDRITIQRTLHIKVKDLLNYHEIDHGNFIFSFVAELLLSIFIS